MFGFFGLGLGVMGVRHVAVFATMLEAFGEPVPTKQLLSCQARQKLLARTPSPLR